MRLMRHWTSTLMYNRFPSMTKGLGKIPKVEASGILYGPGVVKFPNVDSSAEERKPGEENVHPGYFRVREEYKRFQVDDGVPVHLKGGPVDKFLYYLTFAICAVSLEEVGRYFYASAFPPKKA